MRESLELSLGAAGADSDLSDGIAARIFREVQAIFPGEPEALDTHQSGERDDIMELDTVMLADYASASAEGKLNVVGVFNIIRAKTFPARHPLMYVVTTVSASMAELGNTSKIGIKLMDEDAKSTLLDFSRDVTVAQRPSGQRYTLNGILKVADLVFTQAGTYQLSVLIDGHEKGSIPIYLEQIS